MYFDDQKDPVWFDLFPRAPTVRDHWNVQRALVDYVADGRNKIWKCPRATGRLSVTDLETLMYLQTQGGRVFIDPLDEAYTTGDFSTAKLYTEYWFNDSAGSSGLSKSKINGWPYIDAVVFATDAYDEVPRHTAKSSFTNRRSGAETQRLNRNHFLMGDQSVREYKWNEYAGAAAKDKNGVRREFYGWGLYKNLSAAIGP
jgi:hypothetical protein